VRLRVATYNLHAGVDGWGRRSDVVDAAVGLGADVLFLQESWRDDHEDLAAEIAERTAAAAVFEPLAEGWRSAGGTGDHRWLPRRGLLGGNVGLALDSVRPLEPASTARWSRRPGATRGAWGIAIVSRLEVLDTEVVELRHLERDRCERKLLTCTLGHPDGPLVVAVLHGPHLPGSLRWYRDFTGVLDANLDAGRPTVLGGDLNCWGFLVRRMFPGWRQAARGATWPSWRAHSQIDHLLVRGAVRVRGGGAVDLRGSDHRPLVAELELGGRAH